MHNMKRPLILLLILLVLVSCTPWRKQYLMDGLNQLTMDEVAKTLGPPVSTLSLDDGRVVGKYQYFSSWVSGNQQRVSGSTDCTEYILTFDKGKVLRQVRHQGC
jgi:hypothetical protein